MLAKRQALSRNGFDIETFVERMPDNAPPKWAYKNITAIRENTDRNIELLDSQQKPDHRRGSDASARGDRLTGSLALVLGIE